MNIALGRCRENALPVHAAPLLFRAILLAALVTCVGAVATAAEPTTELLWPDGAPGALGDEARDRPQLVIYRADEDTAGGAAIVICPGGGYGGLAWDYEGTHVAQWFNTLGVTAAVVDYRHRGKGYGHPAPMQDAQRAVRMLRSKAEEWGIDPARVGIMGFSAGGHLAATVATHFDAGDPDAADPIQRVSCRPDFCILAYPVISLGQPYTHLGSQQNLLGENPTPEQIADLSCDQQVTAETPPTFLFHTNSDTGVPAENSLVFFQALRDAGVPAELHVFEPGGHGVGMARNHPSLGVWTDLCANWLRERQVLPRSAP